MKMSMRRKRRTWRWWPGRSKRQIHSRNSRRNGMMFSQNMESNRTGQQWVSSSTPEISEQMPLYDSLLKASVCNFKTDTSNDSLTIYQEDSLTIHQEESHVSYDDAKAHKSGKPLVAAGENKSEPAVEMDTEAILSKDPKNSVKPMVIARIICIILKTLDSKNKVDPMNLQAEDHGKQTASRFSRLVASNVRTQSLSPSVEFKNGSKCSAVCCEFLAKGWCIKEISCSFLHLNDKADNTNQQNKQDIAAAYLTTEENFEGIRFCL